MPLNLLFLYFPGIEGVGGHVWNSFGANINISAKLLQLMESRDKDTINGIADTVINVIYRSFNDQEKFILVGHSFGALIAMKIASMLEQLGKRGHVVLIDGSPAFLKRLAQGLVKAKTLNDQVDDVSLMMMFNRFCGSELLDQFTMQLMKCENRQSKIQLIIDFLSNDIKTKYSQQYLENITVAILNRLKAVINLNIEGDKLGHVMDEKLKSAITLIRPTQVSFSDIVEDYGLQTYTEQPVTVNYVEGNHFSVLENVDLANIINNIADSTNPIQL